MTIHTFFSRDSHLASRYRIRCKFKGPIVSRAFLLKIQTGHRVWLRTIPSAILHQQPPPVTHRSSWCPSAYTSGCIGDTGYKRQSISSSKNPLSTFCFSWLATHSQYDSHLCVEITQFFHTLYLARVSSLSKPFFDARHSKQVSTGKTATLHTSTQLSIYPKTKQVIQYLGNKHTQK